MVWGGSRTSILMAVSFSAQSEGSWILSERAKDLFSGAAIITALNLILQVFLLFVVQGYGLGGPIGVVEFALFFATVLLLMVAQIFLWIGLIWFLFRYDSFSIPCCL